MTVGERLRELLKLRGMRISELARASGVRQQTLYAILNRNSSRVAPQTLRALAEALGVPRGAFSRKSRF